MVSPNVSINSFRESFKVEKQFPFILLTQMGEKSLLNLQEFRSLIDPVQNNYVELNANQVAKMLFVTESGKEVEFYNTIIGDDESLMGGYGYICPKKRNNQEIHSDRGNHQVYYFVPKFIKEDLFDAEEDTHCLGLEPVASVQKVKLILGGDQKSGVCFMIILCLQPRKNPFIFNTGNLKSSILNIEKKTISFNVSTNNTSRELVCRSDCSHNVVNFIILDIDLKVVFILVMIFVYAGGKMVQRYKMFIGSDATFKGGYGYIYSKRANNQEIHQEGKDRRVLFFVIISFVSEENLEAEVCIHQVQHILKFLVTEVGVIYCVCKSSGNLIKRKEFLLGSWLFNMLFVKFCRARVFSWLLFLLLCTVFSSDLFGVSRHKYSVISGMHDSGGGPISVVMIHDGGIIGMVLVSTMPFFESFHYEGEVCCSVTWFISWLSRSFASNYPPGGQIKSTNHTIEHPAVVSGQRSPSSSEDG
jgi:hypothetical protein